MQEMQESQESHENPTDLVSIGIVSFKDKHYLEHTLPTIINQSYPNTEITICDNDPENSNLQEWLSYNYPTIKYTTIGQNPGFAKAHNHLFELSKGTYYLCLNSDIWLSPNYVQELYSLITQNPKTAVISPKLLQWQNFPNSPEQIKANTIDTLAFQPFKNHHFTELGGGQLDSVFPDQSTSIQISRAQQASPTSPFEIWGGSGASPLLRASALKEVGFFEPSFFMYKEDVDLMYRLKWAGYKAFCQPTAVGWHDRSVFKPKNLLSNILERRKRPLFIKQNSFQNHILLIYKNWSNQYSLQTKLKTLFELIKINIYYLIFDPIVLKSYVTIFKLLPDFRQKRQQLIKRISAKEMESWFK